MNQAETAPHGPRRGAHRIWKIWNLGIQEFRNLQLKKEAAGTLDYQRVDVGISGYQVFT